MLHHLKNEKDVRNHVKYHKNFLGEFSLYVLVITVSLIIWLLMGGGYFWPLWIILIWGVVLFLKASRLHIINPFFYSAAHSFREKLPFIRPQWENEKVQEILRKMGKTLSDMAGPAPKASGKSTTKQVASKKKAAVKSAPKKKVSKPKKKK